MHEGTVYEQFLVTLTELNHYRINPIVAIDHIHHPSAKPSLLERFTCSFDPSVIAKTVTQICDLVRMDKKERLDYLRDHEAFPSRYLWGRADEDRGQRWLVAQTCSRDVQGAWSTTA